MNRDDIIRMAREQGLPETEVEGVFRVNADDLGRFAELVAAAERKREWVALTEDEIDDIWNRYCDEMGEASINDAYDVASALEAKLKEKNT